jgi:tripartite-type tricarboxylate transporter receptor subunit TctC
VRSSEVRDRLAVGSAEPMPTEMPAQFAEFVAAETSRWARIVKDVGASVLSR